MKKYYTITKEVKEIESITCDKCGKEYSKVNNPEEIHEFLSIDFVGGYDSVFGDGTDVECDICQHCLHEMIKDICRKKEVEY